MKYTLEDLGLAAKEYLDAERDYKESYDFYRSLRNDYMEQTDQTFAEVMEDSTFLEVTTDAYRHSQLMKKEMNNAKNRMKTRYRSLNI